MNDLKMKFFFHKINAFMYLLNTHDMKCTELFIQTPSPFVRCCRTILATVFFVLNLT